MALHQLVLQIVELRHAARAEKDAERRKSMEEVIQECQRQLREEIERIR